MAQPAGHPGRAAWRRRIAVPPVVALGDHVVGPPVQDVPEPEHLVQLEDEATLAEIAAIEVILADAGMEAPVRAGMIRHSAADLPWHLLWVTALAYFVKPFVEGAMTRSASAPPMLAGRNSPISLGGCVPPGPARTGDSRSRTPRQRPGSILPVTCQTRRLGPSPRLTSASPNTQAMCSSGTTRLAVGGRSCNHTGTTAKAAIRTYKRRTLLPPTTRALPRQRRSSAPGSPRPVWVGHRPWLAESARQRLTCPCLDDRGRDTS